MAKSKSNTRNRSRQQNGLKEQLADKPRLREAVYEQVLQMILEGSLQPGTPVSELELTRQLQVSRTPVHEAIGQLVADGLVLQAANRRPVIAAFSGTDAHDIFEIRRILEGEAAYKAAQQIDRMTLRRLQQAADKFAKMRNDKRKVDAWVKLDDEFHRTIAGASGSPRLEQDILRYRQLHRVFNRTHTDPSILAMALDEHQEILEALAQRSSAAAKEAMQRHIVEWQRFFVRRFS